MFKKLADLRKIIGGTPIVNIESNLYAKLEGENPAGSIKDRVAHFMVGNALKKGVLHSGGNIIEASSGNMGIALAYIASRLDLNCTIVMPENMSEKRKSIITSYGAKLLLTPSSLSMQGACDVAVELKNQIGGWRANQFCNMDSVNTHFLFTAPEIFDELQDVSVIVCGIGSGGTVMGIKKYIKLHNLDCMVVGVEPRSSPLLTKGYVEAHKIQGIGANFVPKILDVSQLDDIVCIDDDDAILATKKLNSLGINCGISSGAVYLAMKGFEYIGKKVLGIFADNSDRYDL